MKTLSLAGWVIGVAVAALTYPVVIAIDKSGTDAYLYAPHSPDKVMVNKDPSMLDLPAKSHPSYPRKVREIYGNSPDTTDRVVFVSKERFFHPEELPDMTMLPVDKDKGENPLQVKSLYFFAKFVEVGSIIGTIVLLLFWVLLRRGKPAPTAPPAA